MRSSLYNSKKAYGKYRESKGRNFEDLCAMTSYSRVELKSLANYDDLKRARHTQIDNTIFYYSTPSFLFGQISYHLNQVNLINEQAKVVLEKPLGSDLESFEALNKDIRLYFEEKQIYRIDHYLGKETVQNLMVLRFANHLFELAWNAKNIDNVQITVAESIGVKNRGGYYDEYGALKDMVQKLTSTSLLSGYGTPSVLNADNVRDEKLKVLKALKPFTKRIFKNKPSWGNILVGSGWSICPFLSKDINGFNSTTETFVVMRTYVQNWRWAGVPFYMRTGKRMKEGYSEIVINFKNVPHNVFPNKEKIDNNKFIIVLMMNILN